MSAVVVASESALHEILRRVLREDLLPAIQTVVENVVPPVADGADKPWYTFRSLSELLDVDERTLRRWEEEGHMPRGRRIGRAVRWPPPLIDEWIREGCPRVDTAP